MKYLKYFLFLAFFVGFGALIGAPSAQAVSIYDNSLKIDPDGGNNIYINGNGPHTHNEVIAWLSTVNSDSCTPTQRQTIIDAVNNGNDYLVSYLNGSSLILYIDMLDSGFPEPIWTTGGVSMPAHTGALTVAFGNYQGNYRIDCNSVDSGFTFSTSGGEAKLVEYMGFSLNYPQDYAGETMLPAPPPKIPAEYWINFTFTNSTDQVQAKYSNYNTDPSPLPLLPQPQTIWWHIYQDDTNVTTGTSVCDVDLRVDIPFNSFEHCPDFKPNPSKRYFLTADINPTTRLNEEVFTDSLAYDLTFKRSNFLINFSKPTVGSTEFCTPGAMSNVDALFCAEPKQLDLSSCFTDSFPYIALNDCLDNFEIIFNYITFQSPRFPEWKHQSQCHSLNILDDWLGLPNGYQVCPQIPEYVRTITSPFVAFLLGLVSVGFITKHNKDIS